MSETEQPLISIITLNWNNTDLTLEFLESTRRFTYSNYEILVCDMNSDIDPTEVIEQRNFPKTKILKSPENLGFCKGNNWGMRQAAGDFFFIVNNDTEVTPDLLDKLIAPFFDPKYTGKNRIGVTSPKIKFFENRSIIQYAGFNAVNPFTGRNSSVGSFAEDVGQYDKEYFTEGAHGCAMLLKREVVEKVGMFPEKFFIYYDELDLSARILKGGYKILFVGTAEIYHKESMTMGKNSARKTYFMTRNRIMYMRRNSNTFQYICFLVFFVFLSTPKAVAKHLYEKQFDHLKSYWKAIVWNLRETKYSVQ